MCKAVAVYDVQLKTRFEIVFTTSGFLKAPSQSRIEHVRSIRSMHVCDCAVEFSNANEFSRSSIANTVLTQICPTFLLKCLSAFCTPKTFINTVTFVALNLYVVNKFKKWSISFF